MLKKVGIALLTLIFMTLPLMAYNICFDTIQVNAGGGCISWTTCDIYSDETGEWQGRIRVPFQQCG